MNKSEFILSLSEALAHLPGNERSRVLEYFEEMIDDRIESGMSEEEAINALGSIEDILKEAAPEAASKACAHSEESKAQECANFFILHEPIDALSVNSVSAELHVRSAELPEGITARVDYNLSENEQCLCTLNRGLLEVRYKNTKPRGFSLRNLFGGINSSITVTLNDPSLVRGEITVNSGNIDLNELVFTDSLQVRAASGNIDAHDVAVHHSCTLHAASGDITGHNLTCGDLLEVHTASGDADLFDIRAGKIDVGTASGDLTLGSLECDELHVRTASGDADLRNIRSGSIELGAASGDITLTSSECSGSIAMNSASGDLEIRDVRCSGGISLSSTSGDIDGHLQPASDYTFRARSRTGDVSVPQTNGPCLVEIRTNSGDINF